jgi:hypothetical protein
MSSSACFIQMTLQCISRPDFSTELHIHIFNSQFKSPLLEQFNFDMSKTEFPIFLQKCVLPTVFRISVTNHTVLL